MTNTIFYSKMLQTIQKNILFFLFFLFSFFTHIQKERMLIKSTEFIVG
jgi:hypothetical protein